MNAQVHLGWQMKSAADRHFASPALSCTISNLALVRPLTEGTWFNPPTLGSWYQITYHSRFGIRNNNIMTRTLQPCSELVTWLTIAPKNSQPEPVEYVPGRQTLQEPESGAPASNYFRKVWNSLIQLERPRSSQARPISELSPMSFAKWAK